MEFLACVGAATIVAACALVAGWSVGVIKFNVDVKDE